MPQGWVDKMMDPVFLARILAASVVAVMLALSGVNSNKNPKQADSAASAIQVSR
jgi:hypothetical protein